MNSRFQLARLVSFVALSSFDSASCFFQSHCLTDDDINDIAAMAEGYSGADMANLCKEAAFGAVRSLDDSEINKVCDEHAIRAWWRY